MRKVYVVTFEDSYEEELQKEIIAVFDNEETAEAFIKSEKERGKTYGMWDCVECEFKTTSK